MRLKPIRNLRRQPINHIELNAIKSKIQILYHTITCFDQVTQPYTRKNPTILHLNILLEVLMRSEDHVTDQEIDDLELEIKRLNRMIQFDTIQQSPKFKFTVHLTEVKTLTENIQEVLLVNKRYTDVLDNAIKINLKDLVAKIHCAVIITDKEKMDIVKAIGLEKGHWFKCPKGHAYAIGECGGAVEVARCICGEAIGGTNHHLLQSNRFAGEMDGASRHAWPGGLH